MKRSLSLRPRLRVKIGGVCLLCALFFALPAVNQAQSKPADDVAPAAKGAKASGEAQVEVRFTDGSVLKLALREDRLEFVTNYGKLYIPVTDIKRIEFGLRIPDEVAKRVEAAIADLGNSQYRRREAAGAILLGLREKAYPAVVKATKNNDMEVANRAEELVKKFRESVPGELLQVRDYDVVHTDNSKIAGRIEAPTLKAYTTQFGEVSLRLADVFTLSARGAEAEPDTANAVAGPINMVQFQNDLGKTFTFKVTGNSNGSVWGTDVYTSDSTLATAAVHAGVLTSGQTGVIKVTIVPSPQVFIGTTRNGVSSTGFTQYPSAFRVYR
jgi:hypothetical protein